jgi:hypothetical protein
MTMFRRTGGECVARFTPQEAQVLRQCVAELAALLADHPDPDDPAVERLFPDVYPEDPAEAAEFRRFTEADLKAAKLDSAKTVLSDLLENGGEIRLAEEQADVWLRALNDVRLALGIRLDVRDDTDLLAELDEAVMRDPTSSRVRQLTMYQYLGVLQESLLEAIVA